MTGNGKRRGCGTRPGLGSVTLDEACARFARDVRELEETRDASVRWKRVCACDGRAIAICCTWDEASGRVRGFLGSIPEARLDDATRASAWSVIDHADVTISGSRTPELTFQWLWEEAKEAARHGFWQEAC